MRIAWLHSHLLNVNSGGSRFVLDYAAGLCAAHGHQVTLFCDVASPAAREQVSSLGMELVELDTRSTNSLGYWLSLPWRVARKRRQLRAMQDRFDVIVNSMFPMSWVVTGLDLPKLQVCYEPFAFFYDKPFLRNFRAEHRAFFRLAKALFAGRDRDAVRRMDSVVTINATNVPKLKQEYGVQAHVVYAGIDTELYVRSGDDDIRSLRQAHPGSPLLFHSTDLTGLKGTFPLLEAIAQLLPRWPELKLLVTVYVNDPAGIERFQQHVQELGLTAQVEYLGCLPREALPRHYSAVDFVCQPSLNQPASWPLKEALICGTPIIGGVESEEVEDGVNGARIDVRDTPATVTRLERLFAERERLDVGPSAALMHRDYSRNGCVAQLSLLIEALRRPVQERS